MIGRMSEEVRERLIGLQGGKTDAEFAALLGVSRSYWTHIRNRNRHLSYAVTKKAIKAFPELYLIASQDLAGEPAGGAA